jgi:hypothetical protein
MSDLKHNGETIQTVRSDWQTQARGTNSNEYDIYCACAGDANGIDTCTGKPLKTYDEWLGS